MRAFVSLIAARRIERKTELLISDLLAPGVSLQMDPKRTIENDSLQMGKLTPPFPFTPYLQNIVVPMRTKECCFKD